MSPKQKFDIYSQHFSNMINSGFLDRKKNEFLKKQLSLLSVELFDKKNFELISEFDKQFLAMAKHYEINEREMALIVDNLCMIDAKGNLIQEKQVRSLEPVGEIIPKLPDCDYWYCITCWPPRICTDICNPTEDGCGLFGTWKCRRVCN